MFRVGLKLPVKGLNLHRIKRNGCEKLYIITRHYETQPKAKCDDRLFKDVTLTSRLSGYRYSTESSKSGKGSGGTGTLMAIGAVTIGAFGILTYAKGDEDFRATLEEWIPGTDGAIKIIFQEERSYWEYLLRFFESLKNKISTSLFEGKKTAPRPAFTPPTLEVVPCNSTPERPKPELRLSKEKGKKIEVVDKKPDPEPVLVNNEEELHDLEKYAGELASKAIIAFQEASCAVQDYNKDVLQIVESSDSTVGNEIWHKLKSVQDTRVRALEEAEKKADEAVSTLKKLKSSVDDPDFEATPGQRIIVKRNISNILTEIDDAKRKFQQELANANISERYWKSVKTAREKFHEELRILFPNINIHDKKLAVSDEAFDLFVLHMYHKVAFLQKELDRLETIAAAKLKAALKSEGDQQKIEEAIALEVSQQKRKLQEEFEVRLLEETKAVDDEMRRQLRLQAEIHADHLRDVVAAKEREITRRINRALSEQKEQETLKNKAQLAAVIGRLRGLDEALKNRLDAEKDASDAQLMWGACQALVRAVKVSPPGTKPEEAVRPLNPEIQAITKAAPPGDVFVCATIQGIPEEAVKRGVYPEDALRERFIKVEQMARRLALVPEEGASLPVYVLSYLQSFLLVKAVSPIPKSELEDEPIDVEALTTYDVLQRARYWIDRGDLKMTLRYMNLLKGAPRGVARDWMNEARILLETQQAIDTLVAYAGANSLVFMGGGDPAPKKK